MKISSACTPAIFPIFCAIMLLIVGCASLPPEVKFLAVNVRTNVAELHSVHANDVRALAIMANQQDAALKAANCSVCQAFRKMLEAEIAASKTKLFAEFDQRAGAVLGAQFQVNLQKNVYPKFDELERTNFDLLVRLTKSEAEYKNDPSLPQKVRAVQLALTDARCKRQNEVSYYFIALETALHRERFDFETKMNQKYDALETNISGYISATNTADEALAVFNKQVNDNLKLLDTSYNQLDQALADLSTDLDGAAVSRRFATSFFKGVGSALVDDLKNSQLSTAALSQLLNNQAPGFVKQLGDIERKMQSQIGQAVTNAVNSVPPPAP